MLALVVGAASAAPPHGSAQGAVARASLTAHVSERGNVAEVVAEYRLTGVSPGDPVPLSLLGVGGARVVALRSGDVDVALPDSAGRRLELTVPASRLEGGTGLILSYRVESVIRSVGGARRGHVPVAAVLWPPLEARPGIFSAELHLPRDWRVTEAFPTGLRVRGTDPSALEAQLAVVPSVVSFRARVGQGGMLGPLALLDLAAGVVLVAVGWVVWRRLRKGP